MRVMYTTVAQVKTGQMEAAIGLAAESAAIMRRHGADVRLFLSAAAGEQIDTTLMSLEFESPDAMAEAFDSVGEDTEQQAFMARLHSPDAPTVMTNQAMSMVLPIRAPAEGQGGLLEVHTNTVHPGRFEDYVAQSLEVCDFVEANGAVNARVIQLTYAGMASGMSAITWEVENWRAQAGLGAAWMSDAGIALQEKANGANAPSASLSSAIYMSIPI